MTERLHDRPTWDATDGIARVALAQHPGNALDMAMVADTTGHVARTDVHF